MQAIRKYNCSYFSVGRDNMIEFDNSQLKKLQDNFSKLEADMRKKVCKQIAQSAGRSLLKKATEKTPVKTGNLRRNWSSKNKKLPDGYKTTIFNQTEYAPYVEYGHRTKQNTRFVEGRYMLTKSTEEVASTIAARGAKFIEKAIKERLNGK